LQKMNKPDADLLEQYVRHSSGDAFAAIVERHIGLVYSVALRHTSDPQQAEDITQAVFILLARKAGLLSRKVILPGWLYHTARLMAANAQRGEIRRIRREHEVFMQSALSESVPDALWPELRPLLDEAMSGLGAGDRDALVLRYFQNKSLSEVGEAMGLAERTAQKRVSRALDKLHAFFSRHGVHSSADIIAGALSINAIQAAPAALAGGVTAVALAKGAAASSSTLTLIKGALKIMAWTKAKTAIAAALTVALAAGTATPIVVHVVHQREAEASIFASKTELTDADNAKYQQETGTTPAEVAQKFLDGCSREDWDAVGKLWPGPLDDRVKTDLGGMEVISLGKPFRARMSIAALLKSQPSLRSQLKRFGNRKDFQGPQVFVPYEIRFKDGTVRKWQLAIRCDNPEHRWYFDGGL
ncbi:MAG TPA: sigma-70 family RNA polymerase sigma factor, partial [Candidatus Acidoferrales bacterium]|nr:sigma-70 family RNA polymerase sigma factor [Candidatus Acidoferrales bacterium]